VAPFVALEYLYASPSRCLSSLAEWQFQMKGINRAPVASSLSIS
jgi:hypothetical protein